MKQITFLLFACILFAGCKKSVNDGSNDVVAKGTVTGKVVAANNRTVVRNAVVFVDVNGTVYATRTDVNGSFSLDAPAGERVLNIQSGSGNIFRTKLNVTIEAQKTIAVSANAVKLTQVASLAYVAGTFDKIESILIDSLGYSATAITQNDLEDVNNIIQYNAIFIDCTATMIGDSLRDVALGNYVANGGSLYVSDWAVESLIGMSGPVCPAPRPGGFIDDSKLCTERIGSSGLISSCTIVSPDLQAYLNKTTMDINYDLGVWESVQNYDATFWEVMIKHPTTNAPLLIRNGSYTNPNRGTLHIGGTTNNDMVTICHKPQGTTPVTITVSQNAVAAHMAHGDALGSCENSIGSGRIYFTTFHNEPNGLISSDMKNILDYIILNL